MAATSHTQKDRQTLQELNTVLSDLTDLYSYLNDERIAQTVGMLYYVDGVGGDDTNNGLSPVNAKRTIGAAVLTCSSGDIIIIRAGTYNEDVDVNKNSVELLFEIGAIINAQVGVGLTVSGNYCKVITPDGVLRVNPVAGGTGVLLSGNWVYAWNIRVPCGSIANLGYDTTGTGCVLTDCRASDPLVAAHKIQGDKIKIEKSCTGGTPANTSIGFWVTNNADKIRLRECASQGHSSGGFVVDSGCTNGEAISCVSGGGDGPKLDPDHAFVWDLRIDDLIASEITFAGAPTTYNIFEVYGTVRVSDIYGIVETPIENVASNLHLEVFSVGGVVDLTQGPGTNIQAAVAGSTLIRNEDSTNPIALASAATPAIVESTTWRDPKVPVDIIADADQTTYIRLVISAALASGVIHWHCKYDPLSDGAFVRPV
ncbi:hypothetical protein ES702_07742 [subsurface metagenome]